MAAEKSQRTRSQSVLLWVKRLLINFVVFAFLGGSGYLIYFTTVKTMEVGITASIR